MKRLWASRSEEACNRRANGRAVSCKCVGRRSPEIIVIDRQQAATRTYLACNRVVLIFQLLNIDCLKFCMVICYVHNVYSVTYQGVCVFSLGYLLMKSICIYLSTYIFGLLFFVCCLCQWLVLYFAKIKRKQLNKDIQFCDNCVIRIQFVHLKFHLKQCIRIFRFYFKFHTFCNFRSSDGINSCGNTFTSLPCQLRRRDWGK